MEWNVTACAPVTHSPAISESSRDLLGQSQTQTKHLSEIQIGVELDACLLDKIGRIVCMIANETHQQKQQMILLREMFSSFLELYKSAHPAEALQLEKLEKLRAEMRECCPPDEKPDLICHYEPCDRQGGINHGDGHSVKSRGSQKTTRPR